MSNELHYTHMHAITLKSMYTSNKTQIFKISAKINLTNIMRT